MSSYVVRIGCAHYLTSTGGLTTRQTEALRVEAYVPIGRVARIVPGTDRAARQDGSKGVRFVKIVPRRDRTAD